MNQSAEMEQQALNNSDVVLYALYKLGGVSKKIHTEHIAWEAFKLSKERFSWSLPEFRKRGFPDKTAIRYALEDAKKIGLVNGRAGKDKAGSASEGWQFTPKGAEWIQDTAKRFGRMLKDEKPISELIPKHQAERFVKDVKSERLFKKFQESSALNDATTFDFTDMLKCSPDASREIIKNKFDILKSTASMIKDKELRDFLRRCETRFSELLVHSN